MVGPRAVGGYEQFAHVSNISHFMLPQTEHGPQSFGHETHVSFPSHFPFGQPLHMPQSCWHVKQSSFFALSQILSPQPAH